MNKNNKNVRQSKNNIVDHLTFTNKEELNIKRFINILLTKNCKNLLLNDIYDIIKLVDKKLTIHLNVSNNLKK